MLVLQRSFNEAIVIEENGQVICEIVVTETRGGPVKLGFNCARRYGIFREEVYKQIQQERETADRKAAELKRLVAEAAGDE